MAASTSSPLGIASPPATMNPTTTEHDYRFPRRPFERGGVHADRRPSAESSQPQSSASTKQQAAAAAAESTSPGDWRLQELSLDLPTANGRPSKPHALLTTSLFPSLQNDIAGPDESIDHIQENDPLAVQVWKFFRNTKQSLPNQDRMENLTWRMMYANMRKCRQEQQERYGPFPLVFLLLVIALCSFCSHFRSLGFPGFPSFP